MSHKPDPNDPNDAHAALVRELEVYQQELRQQNEQLREAQKDLEAARARYADLYDFAPTPYFTLSDTGCVSEVNFAGAMLLDRARDRVVGKPMSLFVAPESREAFYLHLERCLSSSEPVSTDLTLAVEAKRVIVQMTSTRWSAEWNAPRDNISCRTTITDITARKQAEIALQRSMRMREDFLAVVSHDLRNPLNIIALASEYLLSAVPEDDRRKAGRTQVLQITRASQRMRRLLDDLLDLSSMEAGHLSVQCETRNVAEIIAAVVEMELPTATQKKVTLTAKPVAKGLHACCDRERVVQVLLNLVENAIKFTPAGGAVEIEAAHAPDKGDTVRFSVRDTGPGIDPRAVAHIFEPYWRAERTQRKGAGLGLSIAKGIVECHGGRIWVESQPSGGGTLHFTIPTAGSQPGRTHTPLPRRVLTVKPDAPSSPALASPRHKKILIVDDEAATRELLSGIVEAEGYDVATVADGDEALRYLRQNESTTNLILLDLGMPGMDGAGFLGERLDDPALASIPVVLVSGRPEAPRAAAEHGLAGTIRKPVSVRSLMQAIHKHAS